jgi:hypothetical protein
MRLVSQRSFDARISGDSNDVIQPVAGSRLIVFFPGIWPGNLVGAGTEWRLVQRNRKINPTLFF